MSDDRESKPPVTLSIGGKLVECRPVSASELTFGLPSDFHDMVPGSMTLRTFDGGERTIPILVPREAAETAERTAPAANREPGKVSPAIDEAFRVCVNALVANARASGGCFEIRGVDWGDAYAQWPATSESWPVVYGTLREPTLRPDEIVLLTPRAQALLSQR